jgi:hypothetical protein
LTAGTRELADAEGPGVAAATPSAFPLERTGLAGDAWPTAACGLPPLAEGDLAAVCSLSDSWVAVALAFATLDAGLTCSAKFFEAVFISLLSKSAGWADRIVSASLHTTGRQTHGGKPAIVTRIIETDPPLYNSLTTS